MYKKTTLDNGLRILTIPLKESKSVTVLILVKTGSKYETREISGVSHFLEHMCFKGTEKRPLSINISEDLDNIGGSFNAFTSQEYTGYYAKVASSHFEIALFVGAPHRAKRFMHRGIGDWFAAMGDGDVAFYPQRMLMMEVVGNFFLLSDGE